MLSRTRCSFVALLWVLATAMPSFAQVVLAQPNLDLRTDGTVLAIARQSDGAMVVGGQFQSINGMPRSNIARLLADGSIDPSWNPHVDGSVLALTIAGDGAIFAGGSFQRVNGVLIPNLVKLAGTGTGAPVQSWLPSPNSSVQALAVSGFSLYVGGYFTQIGGQDRLRIARVATVGSGAPDNWNPSADQPVHALSVVLVSGGNDLVIAGGAFTNIGGLARNRIAKLSTVTSAADPVWNPSSNGVVTSVTNDGTFVYAGGYFTAMGATGRNRIAKIAVTGSGQPLAGFDPGANDFVQSVSLISGTLYVGGWFTNCGGLARAGVARMPASTGVVDGNWDPGVDAGSIVYAVRARSDGVAYLGGSFRASAGQPRLSLARIEANATSAIATDVEFPGMVRALARLVDGSLIAGGDFARANGQPRGNLLRLHANGTLDPAWSPSADGPVESLVVDTSGRIYASGQFQSVNALPRRGIVRLAAAGSGDPDPAWNAQSDSVVFALALAADGSIIAGGGFSSIGGAPRSYIARLSAVDALADPDWNPQANDWVSALAVGADGSVFVGGSFSAIGGQTRQRVAKLGSVNGLADASWNLSLDGSPQEFAFAADGSLLVGGYFQSAGGLPRPAGLAKVSIDGTGSVDAQWNPLLVGSAVALAVDSDGSVFAAGSLYVPATLGPQRNLYKLDPVSGARASVWNFETNGALAALLVAEGRAHVGGAITNVMGAPRVGLAALAIDRIFAGDFEFPPP